VDPATAQLDEEQHVETLEPDRVDRDEVGGQDLVGVLVEELPPAGLGSKGRRWQAMATEDTAMVSWEQRTPSLSSSPWIRR
jgi:hypothetical protein